MKDIIEYILAILITGCVLGTLFPIVLILMLLSISLIFQEGNMRFINQLNKYYYHLNDRLAKGFDYLVENPDDKKALELYNDIIEELSHVEELVNYYKNK